jgi:hypothetical protein
VVLVWEHACFSVAGWSISQLLSVSAYEIFSISVISQSVEVKN